MHPVFVLAAKRRADRKHKIKMNDLARAVATAINALDTIAKAEPDSAAGRFAKEQAAVSRDLVHLSKS